MWLFSDCLLCFIFLNWIYLDRVRRRHKTRHPEDVSVSSDSGKLCICPIIGWHFMRQTLNQQISMNNLWQLLSYFRICRDFHPCRTPIPSLHILIRINNSHNTLFYEMLYYAHMQEAGTAHLLIHRRGFECTKCFPPSVLKLSLDPLTCKEALFKRCFNSRWQCPPLSMPSCEVSVVATRRP